MTSEYERIDCVHGDLTLEATDAIVNAANSSLQGGGGVDGAIHRATVPCLLAECMERYRAGCPTGEVRMTGGHGLAARHVIHAVGPEWRGGSEGERELLASCFRSSFELAAAEGLRSLAFPAISCGVYRFPVDEAAEIAIREAAAGLVQYTGIELVRFVLFSDELLAVFVAALEGARA